MLHIGDIHLHHGAYTAADVVQYAQSIARGDLTRTTYHGLSEEMKREVKGVFLGRCARSAMTISTYPLHGLGDARGVWESFVCGQSTQGPTGSDLLLGRTEVWGLNPDPVSWKWVLHVCCPRSDEQ